MSMQQPPQLGADPNVTSNDKLWSLLSYIFAPIVGIIVVLMDDTKNRPFPRYHAIQSFGFAVAVFLFTFLATFIYICGSIVTLGFGACILWVLFFLPLIPAIMYGIQAYNGQWVVIPFITDFMIKQGWLQKPY